MTSATFHHPTPLHVTRTRDAEELGRIAGRDHYETAAQLCPPGEWGPEARTKWCALLREIRTNPYTPGQYPHRDATDDQNHHYARQWEHGFLLGRNTALAEHRRRAA